MTNVLTRIIMFLYFLGIKSSSSKYIFLHNIRCIFPLVILWINIFTPLDDHFFYTARYIKPAIKDKPHVSGMEPMILEHRVRSFGILIISGRKALAFNAYFAHLSFVQSRSALIHDLYLLAYQGISY